MSFKLVTVVLVVALVGQGFAWPTNEVESSPNESFAEAPIASLLRESDLSVFSGIQNCVTTAVKIVGNYKAKVVLNLRAAAARVFLIGSTVKCFIMKEVSDIHNCGVQAFDNYRAEVDIITAQKVQNQNELSILLNSFSKCLKETTPPSTPPTPPKSH